MDYDVIIIGSGAAGLSAAIYTQRYKLKTLVIQGEFGGETLTAGSIENYPGFKKIDGYELMMRMKAQAEEAGANLVSGWASRIEKREHGFAVITEEETFSAKTVIIAIGAKRRHLGLPKEKELTGRGVHYCVTCDGPVYGGKTVAMVGGGDSSVKGVNFLGAYAEKIYFITRTKEISAEPVNFEQMKSLGDKVEILYDTEIKKLQGEKKLESVELSRKHEGSDELHLDGLFVEIGFDPDTTFAKQLGLELDEKGYTKVGTMMQTNVEGIYAAGDSTNHFNGFKQDITAAALGSVAATSAYEYIRAQSVTK